VIRRFLVCLAIAGLAAGPALPRSNGAWYGSLNPGFKAVPAGGGGSSIFVDDSFTGTDTETLIGTPHNLTIGGAWTRNSASATGEMTIRTNRAYTSTSTVLLYPSTGTPSDADYKVTAVITHPGNITSSTLELGVVGRMSSTTQFSGYSCVIRQDSATTAHLQFRSINNGTTTSTLGAAPTTFTYGGTNYTITLTMTGSSVSCGIVSTPLTETLTATDTDWASAGKVAIRGNVVSTTTTGLHLDSIQADNTP
jgi:hypothetical protein